MTMLSYRVLLKTIKSVRRGTKVNILPVVSVLKRLHKPFNFNVLDCIAGVAPPLLFWPSCLEALCVFPVEHC